MTTEKKVQRSLVGRVVSNKMEKTVTVLIERKVKHPVYGKYVTQSTKLHAHDESNALNEGDLVKVKVLEVDRQGRVRLSMKDLDPR